MIFLLVPLLSFCFPVFTEYIEKKQFQTAKRARKRIIIAIIVYAAIVAIIGALYGYDIAVLIFGEQYTTTGTMITMSAALLCTPLL
jgi:O-antigen/teichoic acid export membrane protein